MSRAPEQSFTEPFERYELREAPAYRFELDRRELLQVLGAGIVLTSLLPAGRAIGAISLEPLPESVAQRLHIGEDGRITVLTGKVEVGQGSRTQITMAAAEELRVSVDQLQLIMADSALVPDDGGTYGSRTTPSTVPDVRRACAVARELLIDTAAVQWDLEKESLKVVDGRVRGPQDDQVLGYGDLASEGLREKLGTEVEPGVELTPVSEWRVLGLPTPKVGDRDIVTGKHRYPSDIVRPDMLYGVVLRPPSWTASLVSVDLAAAESMSGVTAVRDGELVGFAAKTSFEARRARDAVAAKWKEEPHPSSEELYAHLEKTASEGGGRRRRRSGGERGDLEEGLEKAEQVLEETYHVAYIAHAPLEPRAAVAEWDEGKLTVWTGTQNPSRVQQELARTFRISGEAVRVIVPDTGGAFGGKHTAEVAVEAARLARAAEKPVSLQWSREEEFMWAYFRPAGVIHLKGGLDDEGRLIAWEQVNLNSGGSAIETPYDVPNARSSARRCDSPLRQGSYRGLAATANTFARESFMDGLAGAAGVDPLEFRRSHLSHERLRPVLERAAEAFGWARRREATADDETRGVGLACGTEKGSYVAACAEVVVDRKSGRYRVVEVCQAYECGAIQNPANLESQVEGALIQGLGGALMEEILFENGWITNGRFRSYRMPRLKDVPKIRTVLMDRPDLDSVGAGETPIIAVAPAIANALFAATGTRIRSMPIRNEELQPM